jgi:arginine/lysine/histidine transporter system substrate-binding protein
VKLGFKITAVLLASCLTVSLFGCAGSGEFKQKGKLIMATNAEFEPFEYQKDGKIVGIDVDIATEIAKDMGVKLEIQNMNFDSVVTAVSTGKADVGIAGLSENPTRAKSVDFTDTYYDASQVIIVKQSNTDITGKDTLKNKKIAVQKGTTGDDEASKLTSSIERFSASTDAVTELKNGKVDAVVIDSFPAKIFVNQNSDLKIVGSGLTSEKYSIAVRKGNTKLVEQINKSLKKLKNNGTLDTIIKKYS